MRLRFDVSDLSPERGGVDTYGTQLLQHLALLDDPPSLVLMDGALRTGRRRQQDVGLSPDVPCIRMQGLLRSLNGPWRAPIAGRVASGVDELILLPFWRRIDYSPLGPHVAQWRLSRGANDMPDVCHWSDSIFVRLSGTAHVATIHDTVSLLHPEWHNARASAHHVRKLHHQARYATRIITDSENTRRDVINLLGVEPERIDMVPLAASSEFRPPAQVARDSYLRTVARYSLVEDNYIFYVGTIEPRKNLVRLAAAFKAVVERHPDLPTKLVLAGGKGWKTGPIERGLAELGLGERLVLPGRVPQEDLPALLHGARAVAYVSLYEGFGLPPLEAMSCGAAVVASNTSSIPEVVSDAGLLVDPYDVRAISEALGRVMTDDTLRAELAARGLERAARFSWATTAQLTMQSYRRAYADYKDGAASRVAGQQCA